MLYEASSQANEVSHIEDIDKKMRTVIGLLKINQKPKTNIRGCVIYILRALNTHDLLYKIGKTKGLSGRLATHNSGNANSTFT